MIEHPHVFLIGPTLGFLAFTYSTISMEGILYRPNSYGQQEFTMDIFKDYLKAPFAFGAPKFSIVWGLVPGLNFADRIKMLQLNWLAMTGLGTVASYAGYRLLESII